MILPLSSLIPLSLKSATSVISRKRDINTVATLMMSAGKLATLGFFKIKVFQNKGYDITIFVHGVISKVLSRGSNYIADVAM